VPQYLIERHFGSVTMDEVADPAAVERRAAAAARFPEVTWEHTHRGDHDGELVTYCVYTAPSEAMVREHAAAAGLPCDRVMECVTDHP